MKKRYKLSGIESILRQRILLLDGAMGSMISPYAEEYGVAPYLPDLMTLRNPELIKEIHLSYLREGSDIISTNTFNSNRLALKRYGSREDAYNLSFEGAKVAKEAAQEFNKTNPHKPRFVAGVIGPCCEMLSLQKDCPVEKFNKVTFSYTEQIKALAEGGADIILIETVCDILNLKAALQAFASFINETSGNLPLMISCTLNSSGRLLSGECIEEFYGVAKSFNPFSIGFNCVFGPSQILTYLKELCRISKIAVSVSPSAGLPDKFGNYPETPVSFRENLEMCAGKGLINIIGGCCGTTPAHIHQLNNIVNSYFPRIIPDC